MLNLVFALNYSKPVRNVLSDVLEMVNFAMFKLNTFCMCDAFTV